MHQDGNHITLYQFLASLWPKFQPQIGLLKPWPVSGCHICFHAPAPLTYNIPSEQIHTLFVANPGTSPSSDEDIGGPQEIINTNE